jgi:hypothetical protein
MYVGTHKINLAFAMHAHQQTNPLNVSNNSFPIGVHRKNTSMLSMQQQEQCYEICWPQLLAPGSSKILRGKQDKEKADTVTDKLPARKTSSNFLEEFGLL